MRRIRRAATAIGLAASVLSAAPASAARFDIAAGQLGAVVAALGSQAGISVGVNDPGLAARPSPGIHGDLSVRAALRQALRGTGANYVMIDATAVKIVAGTPLPRARPAPRTVATAVSAPAGADIVVSASKQSTPLDRYPGSAEVLSLAGTRPSKSGAADTATIVDRLPVLTSTSLGSGRDKLFIRGIADSSFNGPSQATTGQYLGDARLTYNAPDPNLNLYDMQRVEILVGPQGTLYGSGALGGILRLVPNAPDAAGFAASLAAGGSATRHGGEGGDLAGMVNLPVAPGVAVRGVGFWRSEAGYIDDPGRGLNDINRTTSFGGRLALRVDDLAGWTIDAGGAAQNIESRDGQYTLRGTPPLTRRSVIAQPFDNDFRLAYLTIGKSFDWADLTSTTTVVRQDLETVFDASQSGVPRRFTEDIGITLLSHETRLSGGSGPSQWVGGISGVYDINRLARTLGPVDAPLPIAGVRNENSELAAFGRYAFPLFGNVTATLGGRVTYARSVGVPLGIRVAEADQPRRSEVRFSPTVALSWAAARSLFVFAQYQEGFRAGGLAVSATGLAASSTRFEPDTLRMLEAGFRRGRDGVDRLSFGVTVSCVLWSDIQADLIDTGGLPYTANIGRGRIFGTEAKLGWRPIDALRLEVSAFSNDSSLHAAGFAQLTSDQRSLPNIAETGGRIAVDLTFKLRGGVELRLDSSLRYVGRSQLGVGAPLDVSQGRFLEGAVGGRLALAYYGVSLDVTNVGDARRNRFAFGNQFGLAQRDQITPLRPRSIRLGVDARF